jgi:hypothetical protein
MKTLKLFLVLSVFGLSACPRQPERQLKQVGFPAISDDSLRTLVQYATFRYF